MNELRILTWKYFFKQKWKELKEDLGLIIFISIMVSFIFMFIGFFPIEGVGIGLSPILGFIGVGIISFWILIGIINLIILICKWIKSNWVMASERAEQELNPIEEINLGE